MALIVPRQHRTLDYVTVAAFAVAPLALGLTGLAAFLAYALALVHLAMTLLTRFPGAASRPVPLPLHGWVELAVGLSLLALPWILGWDGVARAFYMGAGFVILVVRGLSAYRSAPVPSVVDRA